MGERAYTIVEIDRMRILIRGWLVRKSGGSCNPDRMDQKVELRLRTYLEAGINPEDLLAHIQAGSNPG